MFRPLFGGLLALALLGSACQALALPGPTEGTVTSVSETPSPPAPSLPGTATPPVTPSPSAATISPTPMPTGTPTASPPSAVPATPTVTPTPGPSASAVQAAQALLQQVQVFQSALQKPDRAAALAAQRALYAEMTRARTALQDDDSEAAATIRAALQAIEQGLAGDSGKLDAARERLRRVLGQAAPTAADSEAPSVALPPGVLAAQLLDAAQAWQAAQSAAEGGAVLKAQRDLLVLMAQAQAVARQDSSREARLLGSAVQELEKGLAGDANKWREGLQHLREAAGPAAGATPGATNEDQARALADLATRLRDFTVALQQRRTDDALRLQRELLADLDRLESGLGRTPGPNSEKLRAALSSLRAALQGDLAKLDEGLRRFSEATGQTVAPPATTGSASSPSGSPAQLAESLASKLEAYLKARSEDDLGRVLALQRELSEELARAENSTRLLPGRTGELWREALGDLRGALEGDSAKFAPARARLRDLAARRDQPAATDQPTGRDLIPLARELNDALGRVADKLTDPNPENLRQERQNLRAVVSRLEGQLRNESGPQADRLRQALNAAREAAQGDNAKVQVARDLLQSLGP